MSEEVTETVATPEQTGDTAAAPAAETAADVAGEQDADVKASEQADTADTSDGEGQESDTETTPEDIAINVPEGAEAHTAAIEAFTKDLNDWRKANPKASDGDLMNHIVAEHAKRVAEAEKAATQETARTLEAWEREAKADPEIGGADFDKNLAQAMEAVETFGGKEFKEYLDDTKLGSHPAMFRFAFAASKALKEASITTGQAGVSDDQALARRYPKSNG